MEMWVKIDVYTTRVQIAVCETPREVDRIWRIGRKGRHPQHSGAVMDRLLAQSSDVIRPFLQQPDIVTAPRY
jgi:hypothetical protein